MSGIVQKCHIWWFVRWWDLFFQNLGPNASQMFAQTKRLIVGFVTQEQLTNICHGGFVNPVPEFATRKLDQLFQTKLFPFGELRSLG